MSRLFKDMVPEGYEGPTAQICAWATDGAAPVAGLLAGPEFFIVPVDEAGKAAMDLDMEMEAHRDPVGTPTVQWKHVELDA